MGRNLTLLVVFLLLFVSAHAQLRMKKIAKLPSKMYETSGLVYYKNKYLITHNDGGNKSEIFVLNTKGEEVKTINIKDTKNRDWEDMTMDSQGRLYIGDFGNNYNEREKCQIYILPSNFIDKKGIEPWKITFTYEDQKKFPPKKEDRYYDCEAFFWKDGKLYLLTKCRTKPFTGISKIYELPAAPGKHKAKLIGQLNFCKTGWRFCSVTSADYDAKTNSLTVLTYSKMYVIRNFEGIEFWNGEITSYSLPLIKQREAICYKGKNSWYMTDEYKKGIKGGNLYVLELKK
jgi:hypothetical protein